MSGMVVRAVGKDLVLVQINETMDPARAGDLAERIKQSADMASSCWSPCHVRYRRLHPNPEDP